MLDTMMSMPPSTAALPGGPAGDAQGAGVAAGASGQASSRFAQLLEAESALADVAAPPDASTLAAPLDAEAADSAPAAGPDPATASEPAPPLAGPDPALLAQLMLPVAPKPAIADAPCVEDPGVALATAASRRPPPAPAVVPESAQASDAATSTSAQARTSASDPSDALPWTSSSARIADATRRTAPREEAASTSPLNALGTGRMHGLQSAVSTQGPMGDAAPIAAPVESPDFAPELAARVSVLARDGVQRAELRLNPLELGPMAVQIAIDGAMARVDFGADAAVTRAAIESSLPALAAALRDAGLTLAGGGVSQHMPGQGSHQGAPAKDDGTGQAAGWRADRTVEPGVARVATRIVRAGGVDLYA
jgi:flagellar hook-length control protein FliK